MTKVHFNNGKVNSEKTIDDLLKKFKKDSAEKRRIMRHKEFFLSSKERRRLKRSEKQRSTR